MRRIRIKKICTILFSFYLCSSIYAQVKSDTIPATNLFNIADSLLTIQQYDGSITYFKRAAKIFKENSDWQKYLRCQNKIARCYRKSRNYDKALELAEEILQESVQLLGENNIEEAFSYWVIANVNLFGFSNLDKALGFHHKALAIREKILDEDHLDLGDSYFNLGINYLKKGNYDQALGYYLKALDVRKKIFGEEHPDVATSYYGIGSIYYYNGLYQKALAYFNQQLEILEKIYGINHHLLVNTYIAIGTSYQAYGEFDLGLEYLLKAMNLKKRISGEKNITVALSYNNIGVGYLEKGNYEQALEYFRKSIKLFQEIAGDQSPYIIDPYMNTGNIYVLKGEYDLALEFHNKTLTLQKEIYGDEHPEVAKSYDNIGISYFDKGDLTRSLEYQLKALQLRIKLLHNKHPSIGDSYMNIGSNYIIVGDFKRALESFVKAKEIYNEIYRESNPVEALLLNKIGAVYYAKQEFDTALVYNKSALNLYKRLVGEKHPKVAVAYNILGNTYYFQKNVIEALNFFHKGIIANCKNFNDTSVYSNPDLLVEKINKEEDYFDQNYLLTSLLAKARMFNYVYDIYLNRIDLEASLKTFFLCDKLIDKIRQSHTSKSDKISLGDRSAYIYDNAIQVCRKLYELSNDERYIRHAFYFSEKNKAGVLLEALAGAEAQKFSGIPDTLLEKEKNLRLDISFYRQKLAERPDSSKEILFQNKLFTLNRSYDELIGEFENQYPSYYELKYSTQSAEIEQIQKLLDNHTALINYFIGDSLIYVFSITRKKINMDTFEKMESFSDSVMAFRYSFIYPNSSRFNSIYKRNAYRFYQHIFPNQIDSKIKNLIIIPDGILGLIPYEALLTEYSQSDFKDLPYLINKYNINYSYSANLFCRTFQEEPDKRIEWTDMNDWLALAPVFSETSSSGLNLRTRGMIEKVDVSSHDSVNTRGRVTRNDYIVPLPGTEDEVKNIYNKFERKGLSAQLQTHNYANESFVKSGELGRFKYIHIATHGFVNSENPELSGILLAMDTTVNEDGILYSGEIYNLELNSDLVVLSACETGLGKISRGEGIIGLSRALLYAGTNNIIVSLWKVADKSTSDFMIDFYDYLLSNKGDQKEFSQALRYSKLKMINEGRYAHPFYWSPFILIGK